MRMSHAVVFVTVAAAALAACGEEKKPVVEPPVPPSAPPVAPPKEAPPPAPVAKQEPAPPAPAADDKWASHKGDIAFVMGSKDGLAKSKASGKPTFLFYTQHG